MFCIKLILYICRVLRNKLKQTKMKILRAISTEIGNEGKVLGTNKVTKMIDNKMTVIYLTKEELHNKIYNSIVDSFIIKEFEI